MIVSAKAEMYELLRQLAAESKAIWLMSSELPELMALPNRILVMCEGQLAGEVKGYDATEEQLMALAGWMLSATERLASQITWAN